MAKIYEFPKHRRVVRDGRKVCDAPVAPSAHADAAYHEAAIADERARKR